MSKIVALGGVGQIGSCGVKTLVKEAPEVELVVADYNLDGAQALAAELGGNISAVKVDVNDTNRLVEVMSGADAVMNFVGPYYQYGVRIVKAAIEAKTNLLDVCDDDDATSKELELHKEAKAAGISVVVGMGATPGITNMMAYRGAGLMDQVDDIDTAWAWTSISPKMTGAAIIDHFWHAISEDMVTYRNGEWTRIPAMSNPKVLDFVEPIGKIEVAEVGHPEPITIPRYIKGVTNVTNRGGVWPVTFSQIAGAMKAIGLTSTKEFQVNGQSMKARDVATAIILSLQNLAPEFAESLVEEVMSQYGEFGIEGVVLRVDVKGKKNGDAIACAYGCGGEADFLTAFPTAIGALMMVSGEITDKGVFAPEGVVPSDPFFARLNKAIAIQETVTKPIS